MRLRNSLIVLSSLLLLTGCSTKVDISKYKDVTSANVVDEIKTKYQYSPITLSADKIYINKTNSRYNEYAMFIKSSILEVLYGRNYFKPTTSNPTHEIKLNIDILDTQRKYYPSVYISTKKGGYYTRSYYSYNVYASISLELKEANGKSTYFTAKGDSYFSNYSRISTPKQYYRSALEEAVREIANKIAQDNTPLATIISKKVKIDDDDEWIFLINMGRNQGIYSQQNAIVYKNIIEKNQVKSQTISSKVFIDKAIVSNQVSNNEAWIVLDDEDNNHMVNIGDSVELRFSN